MSIVFTTLITSIVAQADYPHSESYPLFNEIFKEKIVKAKLDDHDRKQMIAWSDRFNAELFRQNRPLQQLPTIINCLYVALCEAQGPIHADEILTQAVEHTAELPAAKYFSPRNLL